MPTIARELQVDAIIEGSVVRAGDKVRITAKLIEGVTGEVIWAQSFERDLRDVLALQSEVARAITSRSRYHPDAAGAGASGERAAGRSGRAPASAPGPPPRRQSHGGRTCGKPFSISTSPSPGIRRTRWPMPVWPKPTSGLSGFYMHPREAMPKAKRAAETALRLDGSLADAHAALGFIHLVYDWDGPAAEKALLRALDLNPTLATARLNYAAYLTTPGTARGGGPGDPASGRVRSAVDPHPRDRRPASCCSRDATTKRSSSLEGAGVRTQSRVRPRVSGGGVRGARPVRGSGRQSWNEPRSWTTARPSWPCKRTSLPSRVRRTEARRLIRQVEESTKDRYFCPYEIGVSVCEPRRRRHRLSVVSQGCRGAGRLHGMAWRRALD